MSLIDPDDGLTNDERILLDSFTPCDSGPTTYQLINLVRKYALLAEQRKKRLSQLEDGWSVQHDCEPDPEKTKLKFPDIFRPFSL